MKCTSANEGVGQALPVLTTSRFRLRPLERRDQAFYASVYTDEALMRFVGEPMTQAAAEIGVMVIDAWQGRKVAQETIGFLSGYLFDHSGWRRTFSRHVRANDAGAGVMRRLGFREMQEVPGGSAFRGWEMTCEAWRVREDATGRVSA